jgi:hypothetical protein
MAAWSGAYASPTGTSIAINFAADELNLFGDTSEVEGAAGVLRTENWNNFELLESFDAEPLTADVLGAPQDSSATVEWVSNNTWTSNGRDEKNNDADEGPDHNLMAGYLDTNDTSITTIEISDLDMTFTSGGYDVYVYMMGGVLDRGGTYTITGATFDETLENIQTAPFDGEYIEGEEGNYLLFSGLSDADFTLEAMATTPELFRAPVNGIEIVALAAAGETPLLAGDADQDLDFDQLDLVQVQIAGKYLTGAAATWGEGDWNGAPGGSPGNPPAGNGMFDQLDIIAALNANIYLTGPYAAIQAGGGDGDTQTSVGYNPTTGEIFVDAPVGAELTSINIDSAAGIFTADAAANLGGSFDNDADNNIFKATFGGSFGSLSFGNVAQTGLSQDFVLGDLTVVGSLAGGGALGDVDLIYVPEPSSVTLMALAAITGLAWRRRWIM